MKTTATIILSIVFCTVLQAQSISVTQFKAAPNDFSAAAQGTRRLDPDGDACALVKISTHQTGFSFDAGANCIADVIYSDPGVWLYLPSGTRKVTISHKQFGTVYGWQFPINLEPARTYEMTLKTDMPKPVRVRPPRPVKPDFDVTGFSTHFLQGHIGMEIYQGDFIGTVIGVNYSFVPKRMGFYTSVELGIDSETFNVFVGPAIRMLDSSSYTDWQLYAGLGYAGDSFGVDVGTKFGWKSDKILSRWDFSLGCQYWGDGTIVPYVGLGAGITGYAAAGVLGLIACVLGMAL